MPCPVEQDITPAGFIQGNLVKMTFPVRGELSERVTPDPDARAVQECLADQATAIVSLSTAGAAVIVPAASRVVLCPVQGLISRRRNTCLRRENIQEQRKHEHQHQDEDAECRPAA